MLKPPQLLPTPDLEEFQEEVASMCRDQVKDTLDNNGYWYCTNIDLRIHSKLTKVELILSPL